MINEKKQIAEGAVIVANSLAGITWISDLELILRISLSILGLVSAVLAIRWYLRNTPPADD